MSHRPQDCQHEFTPWSPASHFVASARDGIAVFSRVCLKCDHVEEFKGRAQCDSDCSFC